MPEFLWRCVLAAALLGVPAYTVGTLIHSGKHVPAWLRGLAGGLCSLLAGVAIFSAFAPPWPPAIALSIVAAVTGAVMALSAPSRQAKIQEALLRRGWGTRRRS
jgi:hypothetical protein